jgi:hypothetical protein
MGHIKQDDAKRWYVSFRQIDPNSTMRTAKRISKEVGDFLQSSRQELIEFRFEGKAKLSFSFCKTLFQYQNFRTNYGRVILRDALQMDRMKMTAALRASKEEKNK